ncbi:macro domain-containing protein [Ancylobacter sp. SL191]|uniref:macro domain-containing protein n=1 Tax=Ancylobacter sp. SL191 TaxID=2995166 RepID=UPI002270AED4|nr:macro domain-containing protein [Ancylobacter sp. SL191]WAC28032.1 macro domain-containing protein [Ancylobacter sp. SL191]
MALIHEIAGDILLSDTALIAHGVAPGDHFDSGLALALRERYPSLAKDFRHECRISHPKAGGIWVWAGAGEHGAVRIACLLTQEPAENPTGHPGKATLENVGHALKALARYAQDEKIASLALPRLATGVGGLDWADVRPLVEHHLGALTIPVYVYTVYHKGQKATEPGLPAAA